MLFRQFNISETACIGKKRDLPPIRCSSRQAVHLLQLPLHLLFRLLLFLIRRLRFGIGRKNQPSLLSIQNDGFALPYLFQNPFHPQKGRDFQTARQNGNVAGRAALFRHHPSDVSKIHLSGIGGMELLCKKNGLLGDIPKGGLRDSLECRHHPAAYITHICRTLAQIGILQTFEHPGKLLCFLLQRPLRIFPCSNFFFHALQKRCILRHIQMGGKNSVCSCKRAQ